MPVFITAAVGLIVAIMGGQAGLDKKTEASWPISGTHNDTVRYVLFSRFLVRKGLEL